MARVRHAAVSAAATLLCLAATAPPAAARRGDPKPEFRHYFRKLTAGRALPGELLAEHGIDDHAIGRSFALVAGVSDYPRLPADKRSLAPARADVDHFVTFLLEKEYFDEVVVLEDDAVTLDNLNYFLGTYFPDRMGNERNSRFLFAYSGHGFDEGDFSYLLRTNAETMTDRTNSIDLAQLKVAVEKSVAKALNSLVLINACQAGSFLDHISFGDHRLVFAKAGAHAITAGARGQFTWGSGADGHGSYFFDAVLAGLDGRAVKDDDGIITADQLFSYVRGQVQQDTLGVQDPQFGDIDPKTSQGSFFFLRRTAASARAVGPADTVSAGVDACDGPLAADYYSYAVDNGFQYDFIRWIDAHTWSQLQAIGRDPAAALFANGRSFLGGSYSLADDYAAFDRKRNAQLRSVYYTRSHDQALAVLQATSTAREFTGYTRCLRGLRGSLPQLAVWAAREDVSTIELHIRYIGPPDTGLSATGTLDGGSVVGAAAGLLWAGTVRFDTGAPERVVTVARNSDMPQLVVTVVAAGEPAITRTFTRADGVLTTMFSGTLENPAPERAHVEVTTPDNNENRGPCANSIGYHDGRYCTSRTPLRLTAAAPRFFRNPSLQCAGAGCPWTANGPVTISPDGHTITAYIDNWGSPVVATLTADEYEHVSAEGCGVPAAVPVLRERPVLIGVRKECASVAFIKWTLLPTFAEGLFRFGDRAAPPASIRMNGAALDADGGTIASYTLTTGGAPR